MCRDIGFGYLMSMIINRGVGSCFLALAFRAILAWLGLDRSPFPHVSFMLSDLASA